MDIKQQQKKPVFVDNDIQGLYSKKTIYHRCNACEKQEDKNNRFKVCSKCKLVYYCCRECQVGHWKTHKRYCKKTKVLSPREKVDDFKKQFHPLLMTMTMWCMFRFYGNDYGRSHWRGNDHIVLLELMDTPTPSQPVASSSSSSKSAPLSPLSIQGYTVDKIRNLPDFIQQSIDEEREVMARTMKKRDGWGFLLFTYSPKGTKYEDAPLSVLEPYIFEGMFCNKSVNKKIAALPEAKQNIACNIQAEDYKNQINAMATGQANKSMEAAAKGRIK